MFTRKGKPTSYLSKSQFIRGLQCHKSLWLYRYKPELRTEPDVSRQAIMDAGTDVGGLARQLFQGGHEIVYNIDKFDDNVQRTKELINSGAETIYEASFLYDGVFAMVDILHKGTDGWEIYEVKSSASIKPYHLNDVSVQYYAVRGNGLDISMAALVHINSTYVRHGDLDVKQLFTINDITQQVKENQNFVQEQLAALREMLKGEEPVIDIGPCCSDPYECDFRQHCWQHIPENSVFKLVGLRTNKKFELYYNGKVAFEDVPPDYRLNAAQRLQIDAELNNKSVINKDGIKGFLSQLEEPIGMLDFETFQQPVPSFDNQRPYQKIPFQYSLHIIKGGELKHFEFLGEPGKDPRAELVDRLISDTASCKTMLAYNMTFEKQVIEALAALYPDKAGDLRSINDRLIDLMKPFHRQDYYTREMRGSYSIKAVLPALVPSMAYDDLEISDGGMAMDAYARLQVITDPQEIQKIKSDLLKYCELDTLAMVKILEKLKSKVL